MGCDVEQILQELEDALKFAKNHNFPNMNMEQAFIFGTGLKLQDYLRTHPSEYLESQAKITKSLTTMKLSGVIDDFYWNTELTGIVIKPNEYTDISDTIKYTLFPFVYHPKELA